MRGTKRLRLGPRFKHRTVSPDGVRGIKRVVLSLGAFVKVKLYKPRHLVEITLRWQEQLDDNKLNSSPHIGDFNDDR
jgi:hypothetical protein